MMAELVGLAMTANGPEHGRTADDVDALVPVDKGAQTFLAECSGSQL